MTIYPLKGANPAKAKSLYPKGGKATVYTGNAGAALIQGQVIQYNMKQIGIDADIKQYTSAVLYAKAGTKGEKFDAAIAGWGWDYPDPFDFVDVLLNGNNIHETQNNNLAYFNVPAVNKKMDEAAKLVGDDALQGLRQYRRVDHHEVRTVGGIPPPQRERRSSRRGWIRSASSSSRSTRA